MALAMADLMVFHLYTTPPSVIMAQVEATIVNTYPVSYESCFSRIRDWNTWAAVIRVIAMTVHGRLAFCSVMLTTQKIVISKPQSHTGE